MIIVNQIGDNISVSCRDKEYNLLYSKEKFENLIKISEESMQVSTMEELNDLLEKVEELSKENLKEKVEAFHPELTYEIYTKEYYLKLNDTTLYSLPLPSIIVDYMKQSMDKGISVDPLIKNLKWLLKNPKMMMGGPVAQEFFRRYCEYITMTYVDPKKVEEYMEQGLGEEQATEKSKTYEVKITQEGLLACYKTSNEYLDKYEEGEDGNIVKVPRYKTKKTFCPDTGTILSETDEREATKAEDRIFIPYIQGFNGDAFYCEGPNGYTEPGHFIKIGCTHRLPDWSYVNINDHASCEKGLHLGGLSYIANWGGSDIHTCFVNPMNIGAIPDYAGDKAIRVLEYYVYGSLVALDHNIYHSSDYAKQGDKAWAKITKEILEGYEKDNDERTKEINELKSL